MNKNYTLSVVIPARNELFLKNTVEDILKNKRDKTEIIVVLDGEWAAPSLIQHPDVNVIYVSEAIGQRAATNLGVKLSKAKYICKMDAHCSVDESWDRKMIEAFKETGDNVVMVPTMRNLHAFDWKCYKCGKRIYQDKIPDCPVCGTKMKKKMVWKPRRGTHNASFCFDTEPHFQYFKEYDSRVKGQDITETMSLQGSCFMITREKYWELNICDESLGSWGNQGIEVACKAWMSGGRVLANRKTWYAHMFRTKSENNFGFPYPQSGREVQECKKKVKKLFFDNKWNKAIKPLSWLVEKFMPIPGWDKKDLDNLKKWQK